MTTGWAMQKDGGNVPRGIKPGSGYVITFNGDDTGYRVGRADGVTGWRAYTLNGVALAVFGDTRSDVFAGSIRDSVRYSGFVRPHTEPRMCLNCEGMGTRPKMGNVFERVLCATCNGDGMTYR